MKRATRQHETQSPTAAFFDDVAERGREPLLKSASGTIRFDRLWSTAAYSARNVSAGFTNAARRAGR